jgi:hypothetical protein
MRTEGPTPVSMPRDPTNPRGRRGQQRRAAKGGRKREVAPPAGTEEGGRHPEEGGFESSQESEPEKEIGRLVDLRI